MLQGIKEQIPCTLIQFFTVQRYTYKMSHLSMMSVAFHISVLTNRTCIYWLLLKQRATHKEIKEICREPLTERHGSAAVELTTLGTSSPLQSLFIYQSKGSRVPWWWHCHMFHLWHLNLVLLSQNIFWEIMSIPWMLLPFFGSLFGLVICSNDLDYGQVSNIRHTESQNIKVVFVQYIKAMC